MISGFQIAADGGLAIHPLEWFVALAIGFGLLAWAWMETAAHREIARRRKERGTEKANPEMWKPL